MDLTCLETLVGLSDKECPCFGSDAEAATSESGYFLTDHDYGVPMLDGIFANLDCGDPANVWEVLRQARAAGLDSLKTDLPAAMLKRFEKTILPFHGHIGQAKGTSQRFLSNDYAGMQLTPRTRMKDAALVITAIHGGFDVAVTDLLLTVTSNNPEFAPTTRTLSTAAGGGFTRNVLETPVTLPFYSELLDELHYSFSYELAGLQPLNNVFYCCSFRPQWKAHLIAGGFETNDVSKVNNACYSGNVCNGLVLEGYLTCDSLAWLCNLKELNGYDFRDVLARTLQFRSAVSLISFVLDSSRLNYYTMLDEQALYGKRNHYWKRYQDNIEWMVANVPQTATGCYRCRPPQMRRSSL